MFSIYGHVMMLAELNPFAADYHGVTTVHPAGLAALVLCGFASLVLPRRHVLLAFLLMACFIAPAQRLAIFGLDFNFIRILVLLGWLRVIFRGEIAGFSFNKLDLLLVLFAAVNTASYTVLYSTLEALINRLGASFDTVGMYFLFRILIRTWDDLQQTVAWAICLAIPVSFAFFVEKSTGRNLFAFLGGVPEITMMREGRLRCQGAFAHPILAGCFWASLLPLMASLWFRGILQRGLAVLGITLSLVIVVLSSSSTPVLAVVISALGMGLYFAKGYMQYLRWGSVGVLFALHMVMNKPVWHLISRVSAVGGSTGWHRFHLIDNFIKHWDEWLIVGTQSTAHWGWGLEDVTNQYVLEGVRGGILSLLLFVAAIAVAFQRAGNLWRAASPGPDRIFAWALGVTLFVHCVNFVAVSYFGQITMLWYITLAAIGSIAPSPGLVVVEVNELRSHAQEPAR